MRMLNLQNDGIELQRGLVCRELSSAVIAELSKADFSMPTHGIRNADKKFASIAALVKSENLVREATKRLQHTPSLVRVIFFDKTPEKNWLVTWHQDKTVAVNKKFSRLGWDVWSVKGGIIHVQPPLEVLNKMLTFRVHLDPADEHNGCLKVIPGSHVQGILKQQDIRKQVAENDVHYCRVNAGDTVIMRPHLLHASSKADQPQHRRVVHIEFSCYMLPEGISWA